MSDDMVKILDGNTLSERRPWRHRSIDRRPHRLVRMGQAWSMGAPLLLLRTMLGLEPVGDHLVVDPVLPRGIGRIELLDIRGRWGRVDAFGRGRTARAVRPGARRPARSFEELTLVAAEPNPAPIGRIHSFRRAGVDLCRAG